MLIAKKTVFSFEEVECESIESIMARMGKQFGKTLWELNLELKETSIENHVTWCTTIMEKFFQRGQVISFNADCIDFEQTIDFESGLEDRSNIFIANAYVYYMQQETKRNYENKDKNYYNFIFNILKNAGIHSFNFKIVRFGGKQYSFYVLT